MSAICSLVSWRPESGGGIRSSLSLGRDPAIKSAVRRDRPARWRGHRRARANALVALIEPQTGLAICVVRAVAGVARVGKNGPDVAIEIDLGRAGRTGANRRAELTGWHRPKATPANRDKRHWIRRPSFRSPTGVADGRNRPVIWSAQGRGAWKASHGGSRPPLRQGRGVFRRAASASRAILIRRGPLQVAGHRNRDRMARHEANPKAARLSTRRTRLSAFAPFWIRIRPLSPRKQTTASILDLRARSTGMSAFKGIDSGGTAVCARPPLFGAANRWGKGIRRPSPSRRPTIRPKRTVESERRRYQADRDPAAAPLALGALHPPANDGQGDQQCLRRGRRPRPRRYVAEDEGTATARTTPSIAGARTKTAATSTWSSAADT